VTNNAHASIYENAIEKEITLITSQAGCSQSTVYYKRMLVYQTTI